MATAVPGSCVDQRSGVLSKLIAAVHRAAVDLVYKSDRAHGCTIRLTLEESADLSVLQRIELGDREAIYDAIVESCSELDSLRERIGAELSGSDHDVLARTKELHEAKAAGACTATICSSRWSATGAATNGDKPRRKKKD